jgi:multisite-specific tRNA:(cytosine-C5)-methyltransferase
MKFVHGGVKMFMKQDVQGQEGVCRWRIQTEGLPIVEGWVGEDRTVRLYKKGTLRKLLVEMFPKIGAEDSPEGEGWKALGEIGERVLKIGMGCCVLRMMASSDEDGFEEGFTLPLWRSLHSLNLMLPKDERKAMLLRIFEEDVELINHHEMRKNDQANKPDANHAKGSIPAEEHAKELQRRIEAPDNDSGVLPDAPSSPLEPELALAAEQNALAEEDRKRVKELEKLEDDDRKIRDAMPEREGEGDEMNTTV